jgi:hypothetical protein
MQNIYRHLFIKRCYILFPTLSEVSPYSRLMSKTSSLASLECPASPGSKKQLPISQAPTIEVGQMQPLSHVSMRRSAQKWPPLTQWRAWFALTGCFFLMFNSWGIVNAYGTFASYYKQHLIPNRDLKMYNLIGSIECSIILLLSAPAGRLIDANHHAELVGAGGCLVALGTFLTSICDGNGSYGAGNYTAVLITQGIVTSLGMACFFVASSKG